MAFRSHADNLVDGDSNNSEDNFVHDISSDQQDQVEIIGSFSSGIWYYNMVESKWTKMTASSPTGEIAAGDFTGDGKTDVATLGWTKYRIQPPFK